MEVFEEAPGQVWNGVPCEFNPFEAVVETLEGLSVERGVDLLVVVAHSDQFDADVLEASRPDLADSVVAEIKLLEGGVLGREQQPEARHLAQEQLATL